MNNFPSIGMPVLDPSEKYQEGVADKFDQILTGQTFSEASYPALYAELGTNVIATMVSGDPSCPWRIVADLTEVVSIVDSTDPFGDGSLIAKYRMEGDTVDVVNGYNGIPTNVTYGAGEFGQCAIGNGSAKIDLAGIVPLDTRNAFSTSMFVYFNDSSFEQRFWVFTVLPNSYVLIRIDSGVISSRVCSQYITSSTPINNGEFYHIALTYDGNTAKLYINGVMEATGSGTHDNISIPEQQNFRLLASRSDADPLAGGLDQVEMYSRELTAVEVNDLRTQVIKTPAGV